MKDVVLIFDDDPAITDLIAQCLESEGMKILVANRLSEFESLIEANKVHLCILDLGLSDCNGLEIAMNLRRTSDVGIIILTGRSSEMDQVIGLEVGADDYIAKPFRTRELVARVRSVLRRVRANVNMIGNLNAPINRSHAPGEPAGARNISTFDGWTIDYSARRLHAPDGAEVALTTAEFNLMAALSRHPNHVLSRDQIMDAVKGPDWASYDRAIDGIVSRLRQKLLAAGSFGDMLKTVRGVGYMLSIGSAAPPRKSASL